MKISVSSLDRVDARRFDAAAFGFALVLRLAFLTLWPHKGLDAIVDRDLYYSLAQSWLGWSPMPAFDASHPPLYTMFLAAVMGLFRTASPLPIQVIQCVLGAASVPLLRQMGARLTGETTARWAALWVAIDPPLIFFASQLATETLFIAMMLVFFAVLLKIVDEPFSWRHTALGLLGGLCVLCRSMFGAYPAFLFFVLWRKSGFARAFALCALLGVGWFVPIVLWGARNYKKYGVVVPLSTQLGSTLYEGFTLDREVVRRRPYDMAAEWKSLGPKDGLAGGETVGQHFLAKTKAYIRADPWRATKIVAGKAFLYWRPFPYDPYTRVQRVVIGIYFLVVFGLGAAALFFGPRLEAWGPLWALFAYLTAVHAVFMTSLRYRLPLEPFLCLLAAAGVAALLRVRERSHR